MTVGSAALDPTTEAHRAVLAWRREQRAQLIAARLAMSTSAHREASRLVGERLRAYLQQHRPPLVAGYWPIRHEFNPLPCLGEHLGTGARVALPVLIVKNHPLEFRLWTPGAPMAVGAFDIAYPAEGVSVQPDTLLIPLVGFDSAGYRLGYGGGYYDRTAAALHPRPRLVGIAFESARLPSIQPLVHDIPMDCIITERATTTFESQPH